MSKKIENQYQKLTDIEHVLKRSGMYVGSITPHTGERYLFDGEKVSFSEVVYNPAFIKIFDEILSNSVDEHRRPQSNLNEIRVTFNLDTSEITVWDNGGIPVVKHPIHKEWIPEMIFSNLKAGSNFDDDEDRSVAGTNGVGSTLTNIFSSKFSVKTCDGTNKFEQVFSSNMNKRTKVKISKSQKNFTEISYIPDLSRFNMKLIDPNTYMILYKRCLDAAACNPKLTIKVCTVNNGSKTNSTLRFRKFDDFIKLHVDGEYFYEESKDWRIAFAKSEDGFRNVSFVNSVHTKDGGTHVDYITNQIIGHLREMIQKKYKVAVKPNDIKNHLYIFIDSTIINPAFSSQTKDELITEIRYFKTSHEVTLKIAKQVFKSEIIQAILDWVERKNLAEERANLRKLNKSLDRSRVEKLIDAQKKGDRKKCILGIYEGMCLHEDTKIIVIRDGDFINLKIKDINIGDLVISCQNKIEEVYQVSKKIDKHKIIKLKDGNILKVSENHRLFVYDNITQIFDYIKVKDLDISKHMLVKNRLVNIEAFNEIITTYSDDTKHYIVLENDIIESSFDTKICIFDKFDDQFKMVKSCNIDCNRHIFVSFTKI